MKIYRNKLYAIPDAAKRGGVTEDQIKEMITYHVIMADCHYFAAFILGGDIPGLKKKYEDWQKKIKALKDIPVTMLRMDKGD